MMVETILESSQDFGMSNGVLPQWKRELLQRRAARSRPPAAPPAPPPPPPPLPPADDDSEELRYGPGIVKRLKSRYLSLALRDAPRRRPSVLRRAASLEHLLEERPPPAPRARAPRPAPPAPARRDSVKRARSVDALTRLDPLEEPAPRAPRPPRRPAPLLRDAERPPPDLVRSTLRKFEGGAARRPAPAARVAAALRGLDAVRRSPTPEPASPDAVDAVPPPTDPPPPPPTPPPERTQSPPVVTSAPSPPETNVASNPPVAPAPSSPVTIPAVSTILALAAVPEIKDAVASVPPSTVAVAPPSPEPPSEEAACAALESRVVSRAALESISRAGVSVRYTFPAARAGSHLPPLGATNAAGSRGARRVGVIRPMPASPRSPEPALVNGHSTPEPRAVSRIGAAGIERAWSGSAGSRPAPGPAPSPVAAASPWARAPARGRAPPAPATSVVFNFSNRKEVPDYIENDGIILRTSRRNRFKGGEPGADSDSEGEGDVGPPSPCAVRFVNDNVIINGRSSMPARPDPTRIAKLKLQFDDSLTRTFEYPSETSLCEDAAPAPAPAPAPHLADNTHMSSLSLSGYTPSKSAAPAFLLGLTRPRPAAREAEAAAREGEAAGAGLPCAGEEARPWGDSRALPADLLF